MKDIIEKAMLFGGKAVVTVMNTTNLVNEAKRIHGLSSVATAALGRSLTAITFMSMSLDEGQEVSAIIEGGGPLGKIIVTGSNGCKVRGYVENGNVELPLNKEGKLDVGGAVGKDGYLTVTRNVVGGEPYVGKCRLLSGEIASDFAYYYATSEQIPSAIATGVLVEKDACISAGGVFIQPLPGCGEDILVVLEDIASNFKDISSQLIDKTPKEILDDNFGHFEIKYLDEIYPEYRCKCSREKIEGVIKGIGEKEARDIIKDSGKIEVHCEFCNTTYAFDDKDIDRIFSK